MASRKSSSGRPPVPGLSPLPVPLMTPGDFLANELGSATAGGKRDRPSDFSAGAGLTAPGREDAPPDAGGRYRGRTTGPHARTYTGRQIAR